MEEARSAGETRGRRYLLTAHRSEPPQLDFPPVRNGIDYLSSVVEYLDENVSPVGPRNLKYAVLHLQAAAEVLLKARLLREHWSLVFKDLGKATREKFEKGDFESCTTGDAVKRLRNIAGVTIHPKESDALDALAKDRNALQHFGLTHNAGAVEARAGEVLDFLMRFLEDELLPLLDGPEHKSALLAMVPVMEGVRNISSYVDLRLDRLRGELKGRESRTIRCPNCEQMTLVAAPGGGACHFCGESWPSDELLASDYLGGPAQLEALARACPQCDAHTLVQGVVFANSPRGNDLWFCFCCAARYTPEELVSCAGCSRPWPMEADIDGSDATLCPDCRDQTEPEGA
ncbi:hypothetical protein OOK58_42130 [Streptomyces sp. NBC_01728]|uniref:hypothetical protein n=1 Tax=unclassified Streptomyces TaxID=2593676 RepID=UPI00224FF797|nr:MULTISPECIES: hypothetical protein [unclassified Streptomyces]MCX4458514.1 hypothetical protein [Streptomyces sp. NBC_01719]MCX4497871.1 hypothetical protein [Streptomyces sp. NBC_01728]